MGAMDMNINALKSSLRTKTAAAWIREGWQKLSGLPGGRQLFGRLLGFAIPYTGALGAEILSLEHGHARVRLVERRAIRNHLNSIHAIALANLAELTGNLALVYALPDDSRFIVTALSIEYKKKARGTIIAECVCRPPATSEKTEYELAVTLTDASEAVVAIATLNTLVSPLPR
jgi:uncharacterized protein (TIGR00369 family)